MSDKTELNPKVLDLINKLVEKYNASGQDMISYLEGLLYSDYLSYWDYIHLDTLLSLQTPRTHLPDEKIFILYHQITELYFKLILNEVDQIVENCTAEFMLTRVQRINRYFRNLTMSFDVMVDGMDPKQFMLFRMSLLPASGFQSAQYRMIEISGTDFYYLVDKDKREKFNLDSPVEEMFPYIYWRYGATELATGQKTLTLLSFEEKYDQTLLELAKVKRKTNFFKLFRDTNPQGELREKLIEELRRFDSYVNINWPLAHYKSAVRYLQKDPETIAATGGTNWQKYLPPRFQKRIFYPELWTSQELEEWGRTWVEKELFGY